jgi:hypothetical protein
MKNFSAKGLLFFSAIKGFSTRNQDAKARSVVIKKVSINKIKIEVDGLDKLNTIC